MKVGLNMSTQEMVSALLDGELDDSQLDGLLSRWDTECDEAWRTMALTADLLRSTELAQFDDAGFMSRFEARLAQEPVVIAPEARNRLRSRFLTGVRRNWLNARAVATVAAVGFVSLAVHQFVPTLDNQFVAAHGHVAVQQTVSDDELALWQEYFLAHQHYGARGGLAVVSPIARAEAENPQFQGSRASSAAPDESADWMNVWQANSTASAGPQIRPAAFGQ